MNEKNVTRKKVEEMPMTHSVKNSVRRPSFRDGEKEEVRE
jgi:hypothetical protein